MDRRWLLALGAISFILASCSGPETTPGDDSTLSTPTSETVTATVTVTQPAETTTVTAAPATVTVEAAPQTSEPPRPTGDDPNPEDEPLPTTIELPANDRPLGLDDFFNPRGEWEEGRWNIANRSNERGISALIRRSNDLELRLQNQFSTLRFDAGQANDSLSSECTTKIDIIVDGELRETRDFGFNVIQNFEDVDVTDSNAIKLEVSNSGCSETTRVVLSRIQVE